MEVKEIKHGTYNMNYEDILWKVVASNDTYTMKRIALDEDVQKRRHIMAWSGYDRDKVMDYVDEFGFEKVNGFILKYGDMVKESGTENE